MAYSTYLLYFLGWFILGFTTWNKIQEVEVRDSSGTRWPSLQKCSGSLPENLRYTNPTVWYPSFCDTWLCLKLYVENLITSGDQTWKNGQWSIKRWFSHWHANLWGSLLAMFDYRRISHQIPINLIIGPLSITINNYQPLLTSITIWLFNIAMENHHF